MNEARIEPSSGACSASVVHAEAAEPMNERYDTREDEGGWTVFDIFTGQPVVIMDVPQLGLNIQDAIDLAELLDEPAMRADRNLRQ